MRRLLIVALLAALPITARAAVWDAHPALICRAHSIVFCQESGECQSRTPTAVFVVNFKANTVKAAVANTPAKIVWRWHSETLKQSSISTEGLGIFTFQTRTDRPFGAPSFSGVMTNAVEGQVYSMWMECNPL